MCGLLWSMVSVCGRQIGDCVSAAGFQSLALGFAVRRAGVYIASRLGPRGRGRRLSVTRNTLQVQGSNICFGFDIDVQEHVP